jgi:hypothetical protein
VAHKRGDDAVLVNHPRLDEGILPFSDERDHEDKSLCLVSAMVYLEAMGEQFIDGVTKL